MLQKATRSLYTVFYKYFIQENLRERSCDCCVSNSEIKLLLSKPLIFLEDNIRLFMTKALTTFGDLNDFKYFLPRILELMQQKNSDFIEDFLIYKKLNYAEWETWNEEEIVAIDQYFIALWIDKIKDENANFYEISGVLDILEAYVGIEKALKVWEKHASKQSILFIIDFVWNNNKFKNDEITNLMYDWFSKETIKDKIQNLYFDTKDNVVATKISVVYTILDNYEKENIR